MIGPLLLLSLKITPIATVHDWQLSNSERACNLWMQDKNRTLLSLNFRYDQPATVSVVTANVFNWTWLKKKELYLLDFTVGGHTSKVSASVNAGNLNFLVDRTELMKSLQEGGIVTIQRGGETLISGKAGGPEFVALIDRCLEGDLRFLPKP